LPEEEEKLPSNHSSQKLGLTAQVASGTQYKALKNPVEN